MSRGLGNHAAALRRWRAVLCDLLFDKPHGLLLLRFAAAAYVAVWVLVQQDRVAALWAWKEIVHDLDLGIGAEFDDFLVAVVIDQNGSHAALLLGGFEAFQHLQHVAPIVGDDGGDAAIA